MSADAPPVEGTFTAKTPAKSGTNDGSGTPPKTVNYVPSVKVSVGGLAAAVVALILSFSDPSPEQSAALTTLITFAIQYLIPDK
jgi:hypothetical protein